jgi:hypothetical protein
MSCAVPFCDVGAAHPSTASAKQSFGGAMSSGESRAKMQAIPGLPFALHQLTKAM